MIAPLKRSASQYAISDFPAAVGPQMTRILPPSKSPLDFVPGEMYDGRPAVDIVRGEPGITESGKERSHLGRGQLLAGLDRRLAGNGRSESLVLRRGAGDPVPRQRVERLPQAALG